jgi:homoserine kinase type II
MDEKLREKLTDLYNIIATNFEPVTKGTLSTNFVVHSNNSKYFLKGYKFENKEKISEIHSVKKFFLEGGIPVIMPIEGKHNSTYFELNNKFYALFPFVEGENYEHYGNPIPNKQAIRSLGEMCAKIHLRGKENTIRTLKQFNPWNTQKSLETFEKILSVISAIKNKSVLDEQAVESLRLKKKLLETNDIQFESLGFKNDHLIHGDYLDHNVFFNDNNEVIAVFDFEKADTSPREYELFRSMMLTFVHGLDPKTELENIKIYLDAYRSVYPLSEEQIRNGFELFYQKQIHGTWVESEHYLNNNTRVDMFLEIEYKRLKFMAEHKDMIIKTLTD